MVKISKLNLLQYCMRYPYTRIRLFIKDALDNTYYIESIKYAKDIFRSFKESDWLNDLMYYSYSQPFKYNNTSSVCSGRFKEVEIESPYYVIETDCDGIKDYYLYD